MQLEGGKSSLTALCKGLLCCAQVLSHVQLFMIPWTKGPWLATIHWDSPGENIEVGSHAFLHPGDLPNPGIEPCNAGRFFSILITRKVQEYWNKQLISSPGELPDLGIEPGPPALQADSLPAKLPEKTMERIKQS